MMKDTNFHALSSLQFAGEVLMFGGWTQTGVVAGTILCAFLFSPSSVSAAPPEAKRLIVSEAGDLPILITAPHGGFTPIPGVPPRVEREGDRVNLRRDELTKDLALSTARAVEKRLGKRPYLVVAEFSRECLDANRPQHTAYQHAEAARFYQDYHVTIATFVSEIRERWRHGLLLDVHAQWQQPAVLMRGTRDGQTIRGLLERRGWEGLLGRDGVLGSLEADGIPLSPKQGEMEGAWTHVGSYTVAAYGKDGMDGVQLEFGSDLCRDEAAVNALAEKLAAAVERHLAAEEQLSGVNLAGGETSHLTAFLEENSPENQNPPSSPPETEQQTSLTEREQKFADLLENCVLVGRFTIDGAPEGDSPKTDRYTISKATKTGPETWIIEARITYGQVDLPVPVPVHVHFADDTPVISLTDLKIPGLGEGFTTRVLFYEDRYAGTWYHGKVGGHMWGKIEKKSVPSGNPSNR